MNQIINTDSKNSMEPQPQNHKMREKVLQPVTSKAYTIEKAFQQSAEKNLLKVQTYFTLHKSTPCVPMLF